MTDERRHNAFTEDDRQTLHTVKQQVTEINGKVKRHDEEIFGDDNNHTVGFVEIRERFLRRETQVKAVIGVFMVLLGWMGYSNAVLLFRTMP